MNQGVLNEEVLDFTYLNDPTAFGKAGPWALKVPKGGHKTTFRRGLGQFSGQATSPRKGLFPADLTDRAMAMNKHRRMNNSTDFAALGQIN